MKFELESDRLFLRVLNSSYTSAILPFYERNLEFFSEWEPGITEKFLSEEFLSGFLDLEFKLALKNRHIRYWFSIKDMPDKIIGSVSFQDILKGDFKACQIGYKIDKAYGGTGLAHEAVKAAVSSMQKDNDIHRIEALISVNNYPSIRLAKHLGFVKEGISRKHVMIDGEWKDCFRYSLLTGELKE